MIPRVIAVAIVLLFTMSSTAQVSVVSNASSTVANAPAENVGPQPTVVSPESSFLFAPSFVLTDSPNEATTFQQNQLPAYPDTCVATEAGPEELLKPRTVALSDDNFELKLGGAIVGDFFFNSARPVAPATPYYLTPRPVSGFRQQTFDASARQTSLFAQLTGPKIGDFEAGGLVKVNLYSNPIIADKYGILPLQAYGYLQNYEARFAAGLQSDIFNPLNPTVLPFTVLIASGNTGLIRSQARIERFFHPSDESQVTLTLGISEPIPTLVNEEFEISEDNGWPNVEGRAAFEFGPLVGQGQDTTRPFELGFSGVVGQIRTTVPATIQVIADVWGVGSDLRWAITNRFGTQAEIFIGETLGTYGGGVLQDINTVTFDGVRTAGGWCELYYYICPDELHTHFGYAIDDPLDRDLAAGQRLRNDTIFTNLIWDVTNAFRVAGELTYRQTSYLALPNNDGVGVQMQAQWKF